MQYTPASARMRMIARTACAALRTTRRPVAAAAAFHLLLSSVCLSASSRSASAITRCTVASTSA